MSEQKRLLIIDDEDIVLKSCQRILRDSGYHIDTATNGEEGLAVLDRGDYDLVVTDLMMPGMSGMDVLRTIKEKNIDVTVVIFTGYATAETAREALKTGAFDYIPKPFTPEEFRDVVNNAIQSRGDKYANMLDLMAIVSHELKSPVSVVQTTAQTLAKGYFGNLEPKQKEILNTIIRNCQYLEDIIRSYVDLSKMELDNFEAFEKNIDFIEDVVVPVITIPEYSSNSKNMAIVTEYKADGKIQGDENLLRIVVTNLVNNAIKYGRENTEIKVFAAEEEDNFIFSVFNEGVGISQDDIKNKLFSKFGRLKQKGTEGVKGSGLGLYICRKIVEKHNGTIDVESEVGNFVKFIVKIPRKRE